MQLKKCKEAAENMMQKWVFVRVGATAHADSTLPTGIGVNTAARCYSI